MVEKFQFENAARYLKENILDKPDELYTLEKLQKSLQLDRKLQISELLLYAFGHIDKIKTLNECLEEEFEKIDKEFCPSDDDFYNAKQFFESYIVDDEYRNIVDSKRYAELNTHPLGEAFKKLPKELRNEIPSYVKQNIDLEMYTNA